MSDPEDAYGGLFGTDDESDGERARAGAEDAAQAGPSGKALSDRCV